MRLPRPIHRSPYASPLGLAVLLAIAAPAGATTSDLKSLDLEELLKVRVVGASKYEQTQDEVPAAVSIITREEIRRFGWRTLGEALQTLPGLYSTYDRQYAQVGARGLGLPGDFNTRTLITINGNRVNDPLFDGGPTGRDFPLDMDLVERIEFIPGPGGAVYGQNAMFGVVNVITRTGADMAGTEASIQLQAPGQSREARLSWGGKFDNGFNVLLSVAGLRARGEDLYLSYGSSGIKGWARNMDGERNAQAFAQISRGALQFEWAHDTEAAE